jgi:pilus assembly protein CpaC
MGRVVVACLVAAVVWGISSPAGADETIALGVGGQRVIQVPGGIGRVAVGDPTVADVKTLGQDQVLLVGLKEGGTTLLVWRSNGVRDGYRISVRRQDPGHVLAEVKRLLGDREGLVVRAAGDGVSIEGEILTADDLRRVEEILELYPAVRSFARVSPAAREAAARALTLALQRAGLERVRANAVGTTLLLEGTVDTEADLRKVDLVVKAVGERAENLVSVAPKRMIAADVQFVEVREGDQAAFGIRWPLEPAGTVQASARVDGPLPAGLGVAAESAAVGGYGLALAGATPWSIRAAIDKGAGRLLARPTLVCASGEEAEFLAGGEVPIPLVTGETAQVEYRPYGIRLRLRPTADADGGIRTEIEAEVSELDRAAAVSAGASMAVPGFRSRKVRTSVTVRAGEVIVLSGVYSHEESKATSKVPVLGHVPILGELFKQRAFDDTRRELLVFVTPRFVEGSDEQNRRAVGEMERRYDEAGEAVDFGILD